MRMFLFVRFFGGTIGSKPRLQPTAGLVFELDLTCPPESFGWFVEANDALSGLKKLLLGQARFHFLVTSSPTISDLFLALVGRGFRSRGFGVNPKYSLPTYASKFYLMYFWVSIMRPRLGTEVRKPVLISWISLRLLLLVIPLRRSFALRSALALLLVLVTLLIELLKVTDLEGSIDMQLGIFR